VICHIHWRISWDCEVKLGNRGFGDYWGTGDWGGVWEQGVRGDLVNRGLGRVSGNSELGKGIGDQGICDSVHRNICGNVHGNM